MIIKTREANIISDKDGIIKKEMFNSHDFGIERMTIKPRTSMNKFSLPFDIFYYVCSGEGIFHFGEESYPAVQDTLISCIKYVERRWQNLSDVNLELLVFKILIKSSPDSSQNEIDVG